MEHPATPSFSFHQVDLSGTAYNVWVEREQEITWLLYQETEVSGPWVERFKLTSRWYVWGHDRPISSAEHYMLELMLYEVDTQIDSQHLL